MGGARKRKSCCWRRWVAFDLRFVCRSPWALGVAICRGKAKGAGGALEVEGEQEDEEDEEDEEEEDEEEERKVDLRG